ncbi:MAG: TRAP transporter large permease [Proteobacteria bacterium]|nr:TRAP transporter large permease [Pseudomonadota bacterium]
MVDQPILWLSGGMLAMLGLIALHIPIGVAMAIVGFAGTSLIIGTGPALSVLAVEPVTALSSLDLATIPLFLLMGGFAAASGISSDLFNIAARFIGHRRGGLAMATVMGSAGFGAICGSSVATTASMAKIALPEMQARGYGTSISVGAIAGGGGLAILIPPSIIMVIYAVLTEQFVLDLFVAGIVPGIIAVSLYTVAIMIYARMYPETSPTGERATLAQRFRSILAAWRAMTTILVVTVGIYAGVVTVIEAASLGAFMTFLFWLGSKNASWRGLFEIARDTLAVTGMILMMVIGAHVLSYFVTLTDAPNVIVDQVSNSGLPPMGIILLLMAMYIVLGAIFDSVAAMVLTLPFVFPLVMNLGYDPIWWGIINVMIIEIAAVTPPIGINVFVMHAAAPHIALKTIFRGIVPFLMADFVRLAILLAFPVVVTFLPALVR